MAQLFGHEKLGVYRKGMEFAAMRKTLLDGLSRRVAACDHLDRGAESILVNIAHASSSWSPKERIVYLGHANGSALECAACLDVFVAKCLLAAQDIYPSKKSTTTVVLNTAEGNGRFTGTDQVKFLGIAYKATVQSASLVDLATTDGSADPSRVDEGRELLRRIAAMLTSLAKAVGNDT